MPSPEDRAYESTHPPDPVLVNCPACHGTGEVPGRVSGDEYNEVCGRCCGTGVELDDGATAPGDEVER